MYPPDGHRGLKRLPGRQAARSRSGPRTHWTSFECPQTHRRISTGSQSLRRTAPTPARPLARSRDRRAANRPDERTVRGRAGLCTNSGPAQESAADRAARARPRRRNCGGSGADGASGGPVPTRRWCAPCQYSSGARSEAQRPDGVLRPVSFRTASKARLTGCDTKRSGAMQNMAQVGSIWPSGSFTSRRWTAPARLSSAGSCGGRVFSRTLRCCREAARLRWRRAAARTTGALAARHGHVVRPMSPQFVVPYRKSNKNDANDADGIAEASSRPTMRFVALKSVAQQHVLQVHRAPCPADGGAQPHRQGQRDPRLPAGVRHRVAEAWRAATAAGRGVGGRGERTPARAPRAATRARGRAEAAGCAGEEFDAQIAAIAACEPACQRPSAIPGIGVLTATVLVAAVGEAAEFNNGREMAAWLGLVPRQHSTGGRPTLLGVSKRGDRYLRPTLTAREAARAEGSPGCSAKSRPSPNTSSSIASTKSGACERKRARILGEMCRDPERRHGYWPGK